MKFPTISSFPSSEFPPINQDWINSLMREQGKHPAPLVASIDYSVKVKGNEPMREVELSTTEMLKLFDERETLQFVYIPHFITQCIIYYAQMLMQYLVDNRVRQFRGQKRIIESMCDEYLAALRHEMPDFVFRKFMHLKDDYLNECGANLQIMYFTFSNEISKKYGKIEHKDAYCYACIIYRMAQYIEEHDKRVNQTIASRIGKPVRNYGDYRIASIKNACSEIMKPYAIEGAEQTEMAVKVIVNKAIVKINQMFEEINHE